MSHHKVQFTDSSIEITIPTTDPENTHALLVNGLISAIEYATASPDKHVNFGDEMAPLLQLLKALATSQPRQ